MKQPINKINKRWIFHKTKEEFSENDTEAVIRYTHIYKPTDDDHYGIRLFIGVYGVSIKGALGEQYNIGIDDIKVIGNSFDRCDLKKVFNKNIPTEYEEWIDRRRRSE